MRLRTRVLVFLTAAGVSSGCRSTSTCESNAYDQPPARPAPELREVRPSSLEPDPKATAALDAMGVNPRPVFDGSAGPFRQLTVEECRSFAAERAGLAALLERENDVPDCRPTAGRQSDPCGGSGAEFLKRLRSFGARYERNKAAAEALERFYQLADVEGRTEQLHLGMVVLDKYRALIKKTDPAAIRGITLPTADELDLQRARSVGLMIEAEKGEELLNLDLKRRIGVPEGTEWRIWPAGDFKVPDGTIDIEAEVRTALENRPELQMLRFAHLGLSPETLPEVKELLRGAGPMLAPGSLAEILSRPHPLLEAVKNRLFPPAGPDPCVMREVAVRKQQLFDLVTEKERAAADEVRSKAIALKYQSKRVGLARWRLDHSRRKYDEWTREKPFGEFAEYPLIIQLHVARAELISEVMAWHAARVKLLESQGRLAEAEK